MTSVKQFKGWNKYLRNHLYRHFPVRLYKCQEFKATSKPGQDKLDARVAWQQQVRELRGREREKLQSKFAFKLETLKSKIRTARKRVGREQAQYDQEKWKTVLHVGQSVLGWFLGNKVTSRGAQLGMGGPGDNGRDVSQ